MKIDIESGACAQGYYVKIIFRNGENDQFIFYGSSDVSAYEKALMALAKLVDL